ncbi:hypothetical protein GYH30_047316 [Glycine max]|uniref:Uncharacterized protein n=1 Tax=Glycine max TaxID=3847 RepID=A0A0R0FD46_SOYBN|nr:hypothetical protein GYH30_047316 [Glycine max]
MLKQPLIGTLNIFIFSSAHILPFLLNSRVLSFLSRFHPSHLKNKSGQKKETKGNIVLKSKKYNHYNGHQY